MVTALSMCTLRGCSHKDSNQCQSDLNQRFCRCKDSASKAFTKNDRSNNSTIKTDSRSHRQTCCSSDDSNTDSLIRTPKVMP